MILPCKKIAHELTKHLVERVSLLKSRGKSVKLLAVLVGDQPQQQSYVRIKRNLARSLGIDFAFLEFPQTPPFHEFLTLIQNKARDPGISGIILQLPLPEHYDLSLIYQAIPPTKEIEGHGQNNLYTFPLVQACMIGLEWVHTQSEQTYTLPYTPNNLLIEWLRTRQIAVAGRGITTGKPIAAYFDKLGIPYTQTHSKLANSDDIYRHSDIIICGVGKKILTKENVKQGVILLNFGLHKAPYYLTGNKKTMLVGDYDEDEMKDVASCYTITPGGLGPIDILCMYGNLIESANHNS